MNFKTTFLLLGGNLGNRVQNLANARKLIEQKIGKIISSSKIYETEAWGAKEKQPAHLNQALEIQTLLNPVSVLKEIHDIEHELGRQRLIKWGNRSMDIDIIFYEDEIINTPNLIIPHPRLQDRKFALVPMMDIAKTKVHPLLHKSISQMLKDCKDDLRVKIFSD